MIWESLGKSNKLGRSNNWSPYGAMQKYNEIRIWTGVFCELEVYFYPEVIRKEKASRRETLWINYPGLRQTKNLLGTISKKDLRHAWSKMVKAYKLVQHQTE